MLSIEVIFENKYWFNRFSITQLLLVLQKWVCFLCKIFTWILISPLFQLHRFPRLLSLLLFSSGQCSASVVVPGHYSHLFLWACALGTQNYDKILIFVFPDIDFLTGKKFIISLKKERPSQPSSCQWKCRDIFRCNDCAIVLSHRNFFRSS